MTLYNGDYVIVYDCNGNVQCRGNIVGRHQTHLWESLAIDCQVYDVQPNDEPSLSKRIRNLPSSRIRKVYGNPKFAEPKHIYDEA